MKKFLSFAITLVIVVTSVFVVPSDAFAGGLSVSCDNKIYADCTTKMKIKSSGKKISAEKCSFSVSDKKILSVSKSGTVSAKKAGSAIVTVKLKKNSKKKKSVKITVYKNYITTPSTDIPFAKGCKNNLVIYYKGKRAGGGTVSFSSDDKNIASVSSSGSLSAKKKGSCYITVKLKSNSKMYRKIKITVYDSKKFYINPNTAPLNGKFLNFSTYNSKNAVHYTIRSFLEYFENAKGGTLVFKKGTYPICNALYVPSNTTIQLSDGTILQKTDKTGCSNEPSGSMFILCNPTVSSKNGAIKGYNGTHDVKFVGSGKARIDMKSSPKKSIGVSLVIAHCKNVSVSGIQFSDLKYGHFAEIDASKNVSFRNCKFSNQIQNSYSASTEAINIDTPDKVTGGFHQDWSSYDKTPNSYITFSDCTFSNVQRAIGTHQYSQNKYHNNITISNCTFKNCYNGALGVMNWKNSTVTNNLFDGVGKDTKGNITNKNYITHVRGIFVTGSSDIKISDNVFKNTYECMRFFPCENKGYDITYNRITDKEYQSYAKNNYYSGKNVDEPYVKIYNGTSNGGSSDFAGKYMLTRK